MANPNHDARGRFASKSGLNKSNSTVAQRGKARIKEHASAAKSYIAGAAGVAAAGVGMAILQGITKPTRVHATHITNHIQKAAIAKGQELAAQHGPKISQALRAGTQALAKHAKNMKASLGSQHRGATSVSSQSSSAKPRVRVPMGTAPMSRPKVRVPMGRK